MKLFKFSIYILLALALFSCTKNNLSLPEDVEGVEEVADEVTIQIAMALANQTTGISRPLNSADSTQRVVDMRIYVFASKTGDTDDSFYHYRPYVLDQRVDYIPIASFADKENKNWDNDYFESGKYHIRPKLPAGYYYRFLAVGFDENDYDKTDRSYISWKGLENLSTLGSTTPKGITTWDTALVNCCARRVDDYSKDPEKGYVSEIFSGCSEEGATAPAQIYVPKADGKSFEISLMLKRAVAGVLLYVTNVPTTLSYDNDLKEGDNVVKKKGDSATVDRISVISIGHNVSLDPVEHKITSDRRIALREVASIDFAGCSTENNKYKPTTTGKDGDAYCFPAVGNFIYPTRLYTDSLGLDLNLNNIKDKANAGDLKLGDFDIKNHLEEFLKHHSGKSDCNLPSTLYLVFFTKSSDNKYYPIKVRAIKNVRNYGEEDEVEHDDYNIYGLHYNIYANHIYCIGTYSKDGPKEPLDLTEALDHPTAKIEVMGSYQADVDIMM